MNLADFLPRLGRWALGYLFRLGHGALFFVELLRSAPASLRRPYLVAAQVHKLVNVFDAHRAVLHAGRAGGAGPDSLRVHHAARQGRAALLRLLPGEDARTLPE